MANGTSQVMFSDLKNGDIFEHEGGMYKKVDGDHGRPGEGASAKTFRALREALKTFAPNTYVKKLS